jgi:glycosyltransferase involved in cell wall biosynthesis
MGGQERVALDLAIQQRASGHHVLAVSLAPGPEGPLAADFRLHEAVVGSVPKGNGFDPSLFGRLAKWFRRERVDVVHTHNPQPLIYGAPGGKLARAAVVHTKHGANPDAPRRLWLRRAAARFVDAYVAVSDITAETARRNRDCAPGKLRVISNGIDLSRFHPDDQARREVRAELGISEDAWVMGTVGRLAPEKDQALLLRAMEPLLGEGVHVVVVGSGPEEGRLHAIAESMRERRSVHLVGARRDVPRLLSALDVFALSSKTEGLPLVIPEAMAAGLPIVSTAVGGIPNVVDEGETGWLVPAGDVGALRRRIAEVAADRALARQCGGRARQVALQRYSAERMARDYMALYASVLAS